MHWPRIFQTTFAPFLLTSSSYHSPMEKHRRQAPQHFVSCIVALLPLPIVTVAFRSSMVAVRFRSSMEPNRSQLSFLLVDLCLLTMGVRRKKEIMQEATRFSAADFAANSATVGTGLILSRYPTRLPQFRNLYKYSNMVIVESLQMVCRRGIQLCTTYIYNCGPYAYMYQ